MSVTYARLGKTITSPRTYARRPVRERGDHNYWQPRGVPWSAEWRAS